MRPGAHRRLQLLDRGDSRAHQQMIAVALSELSNGGQAIGMIRSDFDHKERRGQQSVTNFNHLLHTKVTPQPRNQPHTLQLCQKGGKRQRFSRHTVH